MVPEPRWEQMEQRARCQLAGRKVFVALGREAWQIPGVAMQAVGCRVRLYAALPFLAWSQIALLFLPACRVFSEAHQRLCHFHLPHELGGRAAYLAHAHFLRCAEGPTPGLQHPSAQVQRQLIHSPQPDTDAPSKVAALGAPSCGSCSWKGGLAGVLSSERPAEPGKDGSVGKTSQLAELNFKDNEGDTC